jgi:hypothetical protein
MIARLLASLLKVPIAVWVGLGAAVLSVLISSPFIGAWKDRGYRQELAELSNQVAAAESTRMVAEGAWARRLLIVTNDLKMSELDRAGVLAELKRLKLEKRELYNLAIRYRAELVGSAVARTDSTDTFIPITLADGSAHAEGEVRIHDHRVPAASRIDVTLAVWLDRLMLSLAVGEAEDGSLTAVAKSTDPHVQGIEIEGITDLRQTGLAPDPPSRIRWGAIGALVGGVACLLFCP